MRKSFYAVRLPDTTRDKLFALHTRLTDPARTQLGFAIQLSLHQVVELALGSLGRELGVVEPLAGSSEIRVGAVSATAWSGLDITPTASQVERSTVDAAPPPDRAHGYTDEERDAWIARRVEEHRQQPEAPPVKRAPRKR